MAERPSDWLLSNVDLLPRDQTKPVLDVACGRGRHALFLGRRGVRVSAVDRNDELLAHIRLVAVRESLMVTTECRDLETGAPDFGSAAFSAVLVFNYLHRPLVPALTGALAAGGLLLYETFTIGQRERGHPRNPDFLLRDGELRELFADLEILRYREGDYDGRLIASLAARKT